MFGIATSEALGALRTWGRWEGGDSMSEVFGHGYALVVGAGADLPASAADARALGATLTNLGGCAYPADHVEVLTEDAASREGVLAALDRLAQKTARHPDATAVVFFSGHGVTTASGYHLVPWSPSPRMRGYRRIHDHELDARVRALSAKRVLVVLDCHHEGSPVTLTNQPTPEDLVAHLSEGEGRMVFVSSRGDQPVQGTSMLTRALVEGLRGLGASAEDGFARVFDVASHLSRRVAELSHGAQRTLISGVNCENFALGWYAGGDLAPRLSGTNAPREVVHVDQIPPGTTVPTHLVPIPFIQEVARLIPTSTLAVGTLNDATVKLRASDPAAHAVVLEHLPAFDQGAFSFWLRAFHEGCLQGPRALAALLLAIDAERLPSVARTAHDTLVQSLRLRTYRPPI